MGRQWYTSMYVCVHECVCVNVGVLYVYECFGEHIPVSKIAKLKGVYLKF